MGDAAAGATGRGALSLIAARTPRRWELNSTYTIVVSPSGPLPPTAIFCPTSDPTRVFNPIGGQLVMPECYVLSHPARPPPPPRDQASQGLAGRSSLVDQQKAPS